MRVEVRPAPPESQAALDARLAALEAELEALIVAAPERARAYLVEMQWLGYKAVTLARQGL